MSIQAVLSSADRGDQRRRAAIVLVTACACYLCLSAACFLWRPQISTFIYVVSAPLGFVPGFVLLALLGPPGMLLLDSGAAWGYWLTTAALGIPVALAVAGSWRGRRDRMVMGVVLSLLFWAWCGGLTGIVAVLSSID